MGGMGKEGEWSKSVRNDMSGTPGPLSIIRSAQKQRPFNGHGLNPTTGATEPPNCHHSKQAPVCRCDALRAGCFHKGDWHRRACAASVNTQLLHAREHSSNSGLPRLQTASTVSLHSTGATIAETVRGLSRPLGAFKLLVQRAPSKHSH